MGFLVKLSSVLGVGTGVAASGHGSMKCGLNNAPLSAVNEGETLSLDGLYVGKKIKFLSMIIIFNLTICCNLENRL